MHQRSRPPSVSKPRLQRFDSLDEFGVLPLIIVQLIDPFLDNLARRGRKLALDVLRDFPLFCRHAYSIGKQLETSGPSHEDFLVL